MGIINEDGLREFVREEARKMKPEAYSYNFWEKLETLSTVAQNAAVFVLVWAFASAWSNRLDLLEHQVAKDREFSHGVVAQQILDGAASDGSEQAAPAALAKGEGE